MKKNINILVVFLTFLSIKAEIYKVEGIASSDLVQEAKVFAAFRSVFAFESNSVCDQCFDEEEQAYDQKLENRLFLHAMLGDQVVGYLSCDLISDRHVIVRQWAIVPSVFDVTIIKDLLFAVFQKMSKIQTLRISCPAGSVELIMFFQDLGLTLVEQLSDSKNAIFEFKKSSKCKLCDLLYGNIWQETEEDEDDQDELGNGIVIPASELITPDVDYN